MKQPYVLDLCKIAIFQEIKVNLLDHVKANVHPLPWKLTVVKDPVGPCNMPMTVTLLMLG